MIGKVLVVVSGLLLAVFAPIRSVQWIGYSAVFVVALSWVYSRVLRRSISAVRLHGDLVVHRYDNATVVIRVINDSVLPVPQLTVLDSPGTLYSGNDNNQIMSLRRRESRTMRYRIRGMNRGSYQIGPMVLWFSDPLGLFPVKETVRSNIRLLVYPSILPVSLSLGSGLPVGTVRAANRIYEDPTRYRSVREYQSGDELRRINWKTTARSGKLHSTEYLPTMNYPVLCLLNLTAEDYERRHRFRHLERTIDATASIVSHLAEKHQPVGMASTGLVESGSKLVMPWIDPASDPGRPATILQTLAEIQARERGVPGPDIVQMFVERSVPFGTRVFYLGPPLEPEQVIALTSGIGQRGFLRLHYTDESVEDWRTLAVEAVRMFRITEYGNELFVPQA